MTLKVVIDSSSKAVKRYGYCDFLNDGQFDPGTETIIEKDFNFVDGYEYTWNGSTQTFDQGSAIVIKSRVQILNEVLADAEQSVQKPRIIAALNKYPFFLHTLDAKEYTLATDQLAVAQGTGNLQAADVTLIQSKIP